MTDIFAFFPRKSLLLVLQSLHKDIAADGVYKATMNLLSLFINSEQQTEKIPLAGKQKKRIVIVVRVAHYIAL